MTGKFRDEVSRGLKPRGFLNEILSRPRKYKFLVIALVLFCNLFLGICNSYAKDKIIAIVNSDVITQKDLEEFVNFMRMQLSREYKGKELEEKLQLMRKDLLDKLIEDRLILQEAIKEKVIVDESRVKEKIDDVRKHYGTEADFQRALAQQGLVQADIEARIREQILMYFMVDKKVRDKIVIKPNEVTNYYNNHLRELVYPEERELEVVALESMDLAKTFSYNLRRGEKLTDLATRYPITVNNMRVTKGEELRKEIEGVVFKLGMNEVSDPVRLNSKYYVFRPINITFPKQLSLKEAQNRIYSVLMNSKMQIELVKWLDELRANSYIKISQN